MSGWLWLLLPGFVIEAFIAMFLWIWRIDNRDDQRRFQWQNRHCPVCITEASVSSFQSDYRMCPNHEAHWRLIHDLETRDHGSV